MNARYGVVAAWVCCLFLLGAPSAARADFGVPISAPAALNANAASDTEYDLRPAMATDGKGNWVAVWTSRISSSGPDHDDEIFVARSIDNGEHWSSPVPLNNNSATDTADDQEPQIATDRQGHWVVVWQSFDTVGSPLGNDNDILVARSADNGVTWSDPAPLNDYAATDSGTSQDNYPQIATDGVGNWIAVWDSRNTLGNTIGIDNDILYSRSLDNGKTWSPAAALNGNAGSDSGNDTRPCIAMNSQSVCVVAWTSNDSLGNTIGTDNDILVARSIDGGAHWSLPIPLNANASADTASDAAPHIALDDDGHCVAVWESSAIPRVISSYALTARSLDNGAHWSLPAPLNGDLEGTSGTAGYPTVTTDGQGQWVAAWVNVNYSAPLGQQFALLVVRSADNGAHWSSPSLLNTNANAEGDSFPVLTTDGHGAWVAAWQSSDALGAGFGGDTDAVVARFALPDCNNNLIPDSTEVLLGLLPDINDNNIPDVCEIIQGPPPGTTNGCGIGICGAGAATFAPLTMLGFAWMRVFWRRRSIAV